MSFLTSNMINVFPCGRRPNYPEDRWLTEYNLINIVNRLTDKKSFVVTSSISDTKSEFIFNIEGYLFKTTVNDILAALDIKEPEEEPEEESEEDNSVYATIDINSEGII